MEIYRPDWDTFFIGMCFYYAMRSPDPRTKHGAVAVDSDHSILCAGYNGPPRGCEDSELPFNSDKKYHFMIHAEQNLIINAARNGVSLKGSCVYITGEPCLMCLCNLINAGTKRVVHAGVKSKCMSSEPRGIREKVVESRIDIVEYFNGNNRIPNLLGDAADYYLDRGRASIK